MSHPSSQNIVALLPKLNEADPDLRYMALNDIRNILLLSGLSVLNSDYQAAARTVEGLIQALKDTNGGVQNMAIECLGPFANKVGDQILTPMIDRISNMQTKELADASVPALALRTIVVSLPRPIAGSAVSPQVASSYQSISKALIPRLVGFTVQGSLRTEIPKQKSKGMMDIDIESGIDLNAVDVLTEVARCFGSMLDSREVEALSAVCLRALEQDKASSVTQKKAVIAIAALSPYLIDTHLGAFISRLEELMRNSHITKNKRKQYFNLLSAMARAIPRRFGPCLQTLTPFVTAALSQDEIDQDIATLEETEEYDQEADEVREAALIALESFLQMCPDSMREFTDESIAAIARFLKYDSLNSFDDDEMEDEDDEDADQDFEDQDFEEEGAADNDDDATWRVRRGAAKAASVLISTRCNELLQDGVLLNTIAPVLVSRFKEREEAVRNEILNALAQMTRLIGGSSSSTSRSTLALQNIMGPPLSRKRRRGGSDASMLDANSFNTMPPQLLATINGTPAKSNAAPALISLSPQLVSGSTDILKSHSTNSKQAAVALLVALALALREQFSGFLSQAVGPVLQTLKSGSSTSTSSIGASDLALRLEAMHFLAAIAQSTSAGDLGQYAGEIIPNLVNASKDRNSKVSSLALHALEDYVKAFTPPRAVDGRYGQIIASINSAVSDRIGASDADIEIKSMAIQVEGLLLGLTAGTQLLSTSDRHSGLQLLATRLKNELTKLPTAKALETVALLARDASEYPTGWVDSIVLELAGQLRKASRSLRGSSLASLKAFITNPASGTQVSQQTVAQLLPLLLPVLRSNDLHMIGPVLLILSTFVRTNAKAVVNKDFIAAFCEVMTMSMTGTSLDALLVLVQNIGAQDAGKDIMSVVLREVSLKASPDLVGKVIANLLVSEGASVGVKLDDFVKEATSSADPQRKCLALAVMGEVAFRLGDSSPLKPAQFAQHFKETDKVPVAAAVALGTAGAGNIPVYLPFVLDNISTGKASDYLLLHSIREILRNEGAEAEIAPYAQDLWKNLIKAAQAEDNRAIGAECVGRLAVVDPKVYLPQLQAFLTNPSAAIRGMVISALRVTFAENTETVNTDSSFDVHLQPHIIPMLQIMLDDSDLENRRLALTTLQSAVQHKRDLVLPHLTELLPILMNETVVNPKLVREVQMGPFKHKVDDGLEIRKTAYENLYVLLDLAPDQLDLDLLYDRVVAGISDDHEIRLLCVMMLNKLIDTAPDETRNRLDSLVGPFRVILANKPKENAVKQEVERMEIDSRDVVRISYTLVRHFPEKCGIGGDPGRNRDWSAYWESVKKEFPTLVKAVEDESKERES